MSCCLRERSSSTAYAKNRDAVRRAPIFNNFRWIVVLCALSQLCAFKPEVGAVHTSARKATRTNSSRMMVRTSHRRQKLQCDRRTTPAAVQRCGFPISPRALYNFSYRRLAATRRRDSLSHHKTGIRSLVTEILSLTNHPFVRMEATT